MMLHANTPPPTKGILRVSSRPSLWPAKIGKKHGQAWFGIGLRGPMKAGSRLTTGLTAHPACLSNISRILPLMSPSRLCSAGESPDQNLVSNPEAL